MIAIVMFHVMAFVMAMAPFAGTQAEPAQQDQTGKLLPFDIRANANLVFGKGEKSGETYYDVTITRDATKGVLVKLPYTRKGGKFSFDLHHRLSLTPDFADGEITTIVEVLTGGGTSVGVYNIVDKVSASGKFDETVTRVNSSAVDKYVTPFSRKTITIETAPGPQTLSIVGKSTLLIRGASTTRVETPGIRIATVSRMKFAEATTGTRLSVE